jgi:hypothetical protein
MENTSSPKPRAKALLCLGFRKGSPCNAKAISGGTICKSVECLAMKCLNEPHHAQYALYKLNKQMDRAISWRTVCQEQYRIANATRLQRIQTESRRLLYAEELQNTIDASQAQTEADETEGLISSLKTMSYEELLSTQANLEYANGPEVDEDYIDEVEPGDKEEYGFHAPPREFSVAEIITQFNSQSLE